MLNKYNEDNNFSINVSSKEQWVFLEIKNITSPLRKEYQITRYIFVSLKINDLSL